MRNLFRRFAHPLTLFASILLVCLLSTMMITRSLAATADDYIRAERFLFWNLNKYAVGTNIKPHWIGDSNSFWYERVNHAGERNFIVVDAASGKKQSAFDQEAIANGLNAATGAHYKAKALPFQVFEFRPSMAEIAFRLGDDIWTCSVGAANCSVRRKGVASTTEVPSPNGRLAVAFNGYNLSLRDVASGATSTLTRDGQEGNAYAAPPDDDVHVLNRKRGLRAVLPNILWSPDSRYIYTYRLQDKRVKELYWVQSVPEDGSIRPKLWSAKYSLPGDKDVPMLQPVVVDVVKHTVVKIAFPKIPALGGWVGGGSPVAWSTDSKDLDVTLRDRFNQRISVHRYSIETGKDTELFHEKSTGIGSSMESQRELKVLPNGDFIWWSDRTGYGHLYYVTRNGVFSHAITAGDWSVQKILRVDETAKTIYFSGTGHEPGRDLYQEYLYSVRFDGSDLKLLTPEDADHSNNKVWTSSDLEKTPSLSDDTSLISPSGKYLLDEYSRPDQAPQFVVRRIADGTSRVIETADISALESGGFSPIEPFRTLAADGKTEIYGNVYRPSHFDPSKKYPIIDSVYPGPFSFRAQHNFLEATFDPDDGAQALAELGFIVISVDGRGTAGRGDAFSDHSALHMELASDLDDHIVAIKSLAAKYPYMDIERVGIAGMSAGGYMAARALMLHPEFYKVGVSASGDHDRRLSESWWGETFNGTLDPQFGPVSSGWEIGANETLASNLKGKLLLVQGDMDSTVHPAQTMRLVNALEKANKDFDLVFFPNGDHGVSYSSSYLIRRKWDYFVQNLAGQTPPEGFEIPPAPDWIKH